MIPLVIIAGPTASGKTSLSIELAKHFDGEIISADSMQIYKYMNIGTAKPDEAEKQRIPHHLMDFLDPSVSFSAADYCTLAREKIQEVHKRGKLPILTGGTGLYIDSLVNGVDFGKDCSDPELRSQLNSLALSEGNEAVYAKLLKIDPKTAEKYHPNNLRRVIRAIEFFHTTGKTISSHAEEEKISPYDSLYFCIDYDREVLYERINKRVDIMLKDGLLDEVRALFEKGYDKNATAMQSIGYKEFLGYLNGEKTLEDAVCEVKMSSRRYAKRQLTWFRRNKDIIWLRPEENPVRVASELIENKFYKTV